MMLRVFSIVTLALALVACGLFDRRDVPYADSRNAEPLQVPEGLDRPVVDEALQIPEARSGTRDVRGVQVDAGADVATPAVALPGGAFVIEDTLPNAWRRVGAALGRIGGVTIDAQDEAAAEYRVTVTGSRETRGFFRRLFKRDERTSETFEVKLSADGAVTRVQSTGGDELARGVMSRLQQRLR